MVSVGASEGVVRGLLVEGVEVAAVNGPGSVVVSGGVGAVGRVVAECGVRGLRTRRLRVSHAFHSSLVEPMLGEFGEVARGLVYRVPRLAVVSGVSGGLASVGELCSPEYWVGQVRGAVRFADGVGVLVSSGVSGFVEVGPGSVLSGLVGECVGGGGGACVPLLREGHGEAQSLLTALGRLHARGTDVDWEAFFAGRGAHRVALPTYAFQRRRYWREAEPTAVGAVTDSGLESAAHPLLGAVVQSPYDDRVVLAGRLSLHAQPWLADHVVLGRVLLPGTAFVELAMRAAAEVGYARVEELTLEAPLALPEESAVAIRVSVEGADEAGLRDMSVYSRAEGAAPDVPWLRHAGGVLSPEGAARRAFDLSQWPPAGAAAVDLSDSYGRLGRQGLDYGPVFQGLRAAWRHGEDVFAEVVLPAGADAEPFGLHPALLDAALHAQLLASASDGDSGAESLPWLPFSWSGVTLHAAGASTIRVRIRPVGGGSTSDSGAVSLFVADAAGAPVASVDVLLARPASVSRLGLSAHDSLFRLVWEEMSQPRVGSPEVPETIVHRVRTPDGVDAPAGVRSVAENVLDALQDHLADASSTTSRLAFVTSCAMGDSVATDHPVVRALAAAPAWGLVRAAAAENPGRFVLVDTDDEVSSDARLADVLASGEGEIAIRKGELFVPRLGRMPITASGSELSGPAAPRWDRTGTVLVTGGTGGLGALLARHLIVHHQVGHLLLTSRRGAATTDVRRLRDELSELGASVEIASCDVADRAAVAALLAGIPEAHPLVAVIHAAGVPDTGLIGSMTPTRLDTVLRPKVDGAWHLHELTQEMNLSAFILFSSAAGMLLAEGQAGYAAANVFLDALAAHRRAAGLPALSMAWGAWTGVSTAVGGGMTGLLDDAGLGRLRRLGLPPLSAAEGLALFDAALDAAEGTGESLVVPLKLDQAELGARGPVPPVLRGLARTTVRRTAPSADAGSLGRRLSVLPEAERDDFMLGMVSGHVAAILGHASATAVPPGKAFQDLGFDSLAAVELRNRVGTAAGIELPATLVFDYPTPSALARYLRTLIDTKAADPTASILAEVDRLGAALSAVGSAEGERAKVVARLEELLRRWRGPDARTNAGDEPVHDVGDATDEELFRVLDDELGTP